MIQDYLMNHGLEQRIFAHYANISHVLRTSYPGFNDPLDIIIII